MDIYSELAFNVNMGIKAVDTIKDYVCDDKLKNVILKQRATMCDLKDDIVSKIKDDKEEARPCHNLKSMLSRAVRIKAMIDKSSANLSKMLIEGYNMGIDLIVKTGNDMKRSGKKNVPMTGEVVQLYDDFVKELRPFL